MLMLDGRCASRFSSEMQMERAGGGPVVDGRCASRISSKFRDRRLKMRERIERAG